MRSMANIPISVIVTVYNAENTLRRCIDGLICQTMADFELILVDDGSLDSSGKICDEYADLDARIKVFHKDNGGVSSARQFGVEKANGQYVIYVDADDWTDAQMIKKMYSLAKECDADIVVADFEKVMNGETYMCNQPDVSSSEELLYAILEERAMGALWNKLIRRSLFDDVLFDNDIFYCEDVLLLSNILLKREVNVKNIHNSFYHYTLNSMSITNLYSKKMFENRFAFVAKIESLLEKYGKKNDELIILMKMNVLIWMARSLLYSNNELQSIFNSFCKKDFNSQKYAVEFNKRKSLLKRNMMRNRFALLVKMKNFLKKRTVCIGRKKCLF